MTYLGRSVTYQYSRAQCAPPPREDLLVSPWEFSWWPRKISWWNFSWWPREISWWNLSWWPTDMSSYIWPDICQWPRKIFFTYSILTPPPQERISWSHRENSLGDQEKSLGETSPGDQEKSFGQTSPGDQDKSLDETFPGDREIYLLLMIKANNPSFEQSKIMGQNCRCMMPEYRQSQPPTIASQGWLNFSFRILSHLKNALRMKDVCSLL